jgi:hypothetical protein
VQGRALAAIFLLIGIGVAGAAPNIPASELPGRERERFLESPIDRFTNPSRQTEPLIRWECRDSAPQRRGKKQRAKRKRGC